MKIFFKLKSFPHFSETFIASNILFAKKKSYSFKIILDRFLGFENSSQKEQLEKERINENLIKPFSFNRNILKKGVQILGILSDLRILKYFIKYCNYKKSINLKLLNAIYQFRDVKNDVIHVHFNNAIHPIIDLTSIGYISPKCIITFHGYDAFLENPKSFIKKYGTFYKKNVIAVTVNSKYLKSNIIELGINPDLISVIPIGLDTIKFKAKPKQINKSKTIKLITVGRLIQLKGQEYAIEAVKLLLESNYNVEYTIVGHGLNFNYLKELIQKYNLEDYVKFEGESSQQKIIQLLKSSDIFIMPSTYDNKTMRREAFGLVSIEAQAIGLPVIGFDSGGFPETIINKKTGYTVKDRDVKAMVKKIRSLINNPKQFEIMSSNAISHSKNFDLDNTFKKYLDLYDLYLEANS
jgi:colanic acid/amylovoran biosynthesis glycosyltransferase